ncbi:methyl-accepting chemotaxis protein [Oceanobacillus damuensis]|uniref:methyl-accepting chemotaxis protein n=1 Tax=Oceanobacillus damuensis TaxID=937928 RepID=UPI00082E0CBD|nr:methyl-accepting chemotaxis protein [Oceanobacillus damuensis]
MNNKKTLQRQFVFTMFITLISITILSGALQFIFIQNHVEENVERETNMIAKSVEQGIAETDIASRAIEQQIDYKLEMVTNLISDQLPASTESITNEQLTNLSTDMDIAGIDIFAYDENDVISVVKSTEPEELGFTLKGVSEEGYAAFENILGGNVTEFTGPASYINDNTIVLYTAQAGSREELQFFKYAYHYEPGRDYLISTFIEANEVNQFTEEVGPETWIQKVLDENKNALEIAVLDPRVFADPSLAEAMYPPQEKLVYGDYRLKTDEQVLINMVESPELVTTIDEHKNEKVYKMFTPFDDGRVIYVAMDYEKISAPFKNYSFILIAFGFISLVILFLTTTRFFNKIYTHITKIIAQIKSYEKGDFTERSKIKGSGELGRLSQSTNKMGETMQGVLGEMHKQAVKTEHHAYLLEAEANNSVEKIYSISMEATTDARESAEELAYLITQIEKILEENKIADHLVYENFSRIQSLMENQATSTTEMTITLSDLLKSLHGQSASLSEIAKKLLNNLEQFKLNDNSDMGE